MKTQNLAYAFIWINFPISIVLLIVVLTTSRAESLELSLSLLLGHYLFMGTIGSVVGVAVLARLVRMASHYGESVAVIDVAKSVTGQLVDDYNRLKKIRGEEPVNPKTWVDTYER